MSDIEHRIKRLERFVDVHEELGVAESMIKYWKEEAINSLKIIQQLRRERDDWKKTLTADLDTAKESIDLLTNRVVEANKRIAELEKSLQVWLDMDKE